MKHRTTRRLPALLLALALICSLTLPAAAADITLSKTSLALVLNGAETLTAAPAGTSVTWKSGDPSIATVDPASGLVTARGLGETTITATAADGGTAECKVTVSYNTVSNMGLSTSELTLARPGEGSAQTLTAAVTPDNADPTVTWEVVGGSSSVISIDPKSGRSTTVTGLKPGTAKISATTNGKSPTGDTVSRECEVTVSGILLSGGGRSPATAIDLTLLMGRSETLSYQTFGGATAGALLWESDNDAVASVSGGRIAAISPGKAQIRAWVNGTGYEATCEVTVQEDVADAIEREIDGGETLPFEELISTLQSRCRDKTGSALSYLTSLSVPSDQGALYYHYVSDGIQNHGVGSGEQFYVSPGTAQQALDEITFVPEPGFTGTAIIKYVGFDAKETAFTGTIRVTVEDSGDVSYRTAEDQPIDFVLEDFINICRAKTGRAFSHVTFTQPSSSRGTLYFRYSPTAVYNQKVDSGTQFRSSGTYAVEDVTFVPAEGFSGTATVSYRCTDTAGGVYSGRVSIEVSNSGGGGSGEGDVEYTVRSGRTLDLRASDFNDACQDANDEDLDYIRFDSLPRSREGILYYNYTGSSSTRVSTGTSYYRTGSGRRISNITFVPDDDFTGTVYIPFTGRDEYGDTFSGDLIVRVTGSGSTGSSGDLYYSTGRNEPVGFSASDFNEACRDANGRTLDYVTFDLPSSSRGTLRYNYTSSSSRGSAVSASTRYYRSGTPSLSNVTFVPASGFTGTVTISFTGRDTSGGRFDGEVEIDVDGTSSSGRTISYSTVSGGVVDFSASDFNSVCRARTGDSLDRVTFDLPASRYGTLYYRYDKDRGSGTRVTSSTSYYRTGGSRLLDDVSFAAAGTSGTVTIGYTGWSDDGERFTGEVEISIGASSVGTINFTGSSLPIALRTASFQSVCQSALGGTLSYIRLDSLPAPAAGRLYLDYLSPTQPGTAAALSTGYYVSGTPSIAQLSFVPRAEYQGQTSFTYTGYDSRGRSYTGTVNLYLSSAYCTTSFTDLGSQWDWARPSIEFLRQSGVAGGYGTEFRPGSPITRGAFTLMVCRAFGFPTDSSDTGFPDVLPGSVYAGAVASAGRLGIAQGSGGLFHPTNSITRQAAMTMIARAMQAAGKSFPTVPASALTSYGDGAQVAPYAQGAVAGLIQLGAVRGDGANQLRPTAEMTRAEMAVILHHVLTL